MSIIFNILSSTLRIVLIIEKKFSFQDLSIKFNILLIEQYLYDIVVYSIRLEIFVDIPNGSIDLIPADGFRLSGFYAWIEDEDMDTRDFVVERPGLENLFLQLTGRDLRE